jgi:hypothetical protein
VLDRGSHHHQPQSRNSLLVVVLWSKTGEECSHICRRRLDGGPFDLRQETGSDSEETHSSTRYTVWSSSQKTHPSASFTVRIKFLKIQPDAREWWNGVIFFYGYSNTRRQVLYVYWVQRGYFPFLIAFGPASLARRALSLFLTLSASRAAAASRSLIPLWMWILYCCSLHFSFCFSTSTILCHLSRAERPV